MKALLLSGGLESAALAYWRRPDVAVTVDYGQLPAVGEIRAAAAIAAELEIEHVVIRSDSYLAAPPPRTKHGQWWPYRNQLLITLAAIHLHDRKLSELWIGLVKGDIYRDCTPEFMKAITDLMLIQEQRILVSAPAMAMTTVELLLASDISPQLLGVSISCHFGDSPCGMCAGCAKSRVARAEYDRLRSEI